MKKFICGLLSGIVVASLIGVVALEYNVYPNPYNIKVNGTDAQIEGYNINDYSYFKLRDIGEKTGFNVSFENDTIVIDTDEDAPIQTKAPTSTGVGVPVIDQYGNGKTSDGLSVMYNTVSWGQILSTYFYNQDRNQSWLTMTGDGITDRGVLIFEIPDPITLEYYENTLLPYIQELISSGRIVYKN